MQIVIKGRNLEISDSLRAYVEKRTTKLGRFLDNILAVTVELSTEKTRSAQTRQVAQVTVDVSGTLLRAEVRAQDTFAAVDAVMDKTRRQIKTYKDRLVSRGKVTTGRAQPTRPSIRTAEVGAPSGKAEPEEADEAEEAGETEVAGGEGRIVRSKHFSVKPMSAEEAIDQMILLGHDFFIFLDESTGATSVAYKRRDGNYGLLVPEIA
jgi:putative sigma-54 modulation protein